MNKILIIDDEKLLANMYKTSLVKGGYEVIVLGDAIGGLKKISEVKPDLILLDIMLPEVNGLDLLNQLKNDKALSTIPVIMLTNLTWQPGPEVPLEHGALDVWVKARNKPADVLEKVNKFFENRQSK